jgi:DNA-binding NarL/FixJ family response regulator
MTATTGFVADYPAAPDTRHALPSIGERHRLGDPLARLTIREREVLGLLAEGRSNSSIARHLRTTQRTVETHTSRIFAKLGLEVAPSTHRRVLAVLTYLEAAGMLVGATGSAPSHGL